MESGSRFVRSLSWRGDRYLAGATLICLLSLAVVADEIETSSRESAPRIVATALQKKPAGSKSSARAGKTQALGALEGIWPQFLGPARNNISPETGLLKRWPANGPKPEFKISGLGIGFSNIAVADDLIFTMGDRGGSEYVFAFALNGGQKAWEFEIGRSYSNSYGDGPRGTPTVDGDKVYAQSAHGDVACLDAKTGQAVWTKNVLRDHGGSVPGWGICESVLIDGDRLVCTPGGNGATVVALHKGTGEVVWKGKTPQGESAGYASPIVIDVDGVRQYVQFTSRGTVSFRAEDGEFLWRDDGAANGTANCSTPVFADDMVFSASGYGKGGAMVRLVSRGGETRATPGYQTKDLKVHHGGLVLLNGHVYGSNDPGVLTCLELKTGRVKWTNRSVGKASLTCADGNLIVRSEQGPVALVQAVPTGYKELGRFQQPERSDKPSWTYPVVADGKLFLRDQDILLVYALKGR
jgi:outer membrane protein assembly factor BamB